VLVKNRSSRPLFIERDPNWDDQVLLVSGRKLGARHEVAPGSRATISQNGWGDQGDEYMMGVIFSENTEAAYQLSVGQAPELGITEDSSWGELHTRYELSNQQPWSMTMMFTDVSPNDG
jgi:hypothetical protein